MVYARDAVRKLETIDLSKLPRSIETYLFLPMHVLMRFGRWDEMLAEPAPDKRYPLALALWHNGRAIALANLGRIDEAKREAQAFEETALEIPPDRTVKRADMTTFLGVAGGMMNGELLYKEGYPEPAFAAFREAIEHEDSMPYSEPPGWMQPVRHAYGALLLESGRIEEAEAVYRKDLEHHPGNGWSLHGLAEALDMKGRAAEAEITREAFRHAWRNADVEIRGSCFCREAVSTR